MIPMPRLSLLFAALALVLAPLSASAQDPPLRAERAFFTKVGFGLSDYSGDFDPKPFDFDEFDGSGTDGVPLEGGLELGYQFSPRLGLSTGYRLGNFPRVENNSGASPIRHTAMMLARYTAGGATWRLAPYADLGGHLTFGGASTAVGPSGGLGVDLALNDRTSLYLESRTHWTFDDDALDGADTGNPFDAATSLLGVGVKYTFAPRERAPRLLAVDGPASVDVGSPATYTASVAPRSGTSTGYRWTFGDGTTASGATVTHTFRQPGAYAVGVTASDATGADTQTLQTTVQPRAARIVAVGAAPSPASTGQPVAFTSTVEGDALTLSWDFGDGSTGTGNAPSHTYASAGTYTATLTASNSRGTDTRAVTVDVENALAAICLSVQDLNTAFFARNASVVTTESAAALRENVEVLAQCPNLTVRVEGFASTVERNADRLAADRARAVETFYVDNGIDAARVQAEGRGAVSAQTTKKGGAQQLRRAVSIPVRTSVSALN